MLESTCPPTGGFTSFGGTARRKPQHTLSPPRGGYLGGVYPGGGSRGSGQIVPSYVLVNEYVNLAISNVLVNEYVNLATISNVPKTKYMTLGPKFFC